MKKITILGFFLLALQACGTADDNAELVQEGSYLLSESPGTQAESCTTFQALQWYEKNRKSAGFEPGETIEVKSSEKGLVLTDSLGKLELVKTNTNEHYAAIQENYTFDGCNVKHIFEFSLLPLDAGDGFDLQKTEMLTITKKTDDCPFVIETCDLTDTVLADLK